MMGRLPRCLLYPPSTTSHNNSLLPRKLLDSSNCYLVLNVFGKSECFFTHFLDDGVLNFF